MKKGKILVTSIGSVAGDIIIKKLKSFNFYVVGCDIYPKEWNANTQLLDCFYRVPHSKCEDYITSILNICISEGVKFIIPLTDLEIDVYESNRNVFEDIDVMVCISERRTIELARNKKKMSDYISSTLQEIKAIPTYNLREFDMKCPFPLICKPVNGRSSQGKTIISDITDLEYVKRKYESSDVIIQPYIEGRVIVADIVRSPKRNSRTVVISRRELLRTQHGCGITVEIFYDEVLEKICKVLAESIGVLGCVNFEFIEDYKRDIYFMECNPRFSAGTVFSCMAGYDLVNNHLKVFQGEEIEDFRLKNEYIYARKYSEYKMSSSAILDAATTR